eukprot:Em0023g182a
MTSYRHDTVLRPFPPMYQKGDHKDIEKLVEIFDAIPPLDQIPYNFDQLYPEAFQLLRWTLNTKGFTVCSNPSAMQKLAGHVGLVPRPQLIFELCYSKESEEKFKRLSSSYGTFMGYHGSRVENFHSIMHNGLLSHFNKTSLFGEGTYLSSELSVSMNFSPAGLLWPKSTLPSLVSCVAVCEVLNHPDIRSRVQAGGEPSVGQKLPEKYFVVQNNEHLRVKYIFVFGHKRGQPVSESWLMKHKFLCLILVYVLFLFIMSVLQSRQFKTLYSKYWLSS